MLFNSLEYFLFLAVVFVGFWTLARTRLLRTGFLLVASYLFYMSWNPVYILLIIGSTLLDFYCGRAIAASDDHRTRTRYLTLSLGGNLALLGLFKYADFFWSNFLTLARWATDFFWSNFLTLARWLELPTTVPSVGFHWPEGLPASFDLVLPVGISFYTFQTMSYSLDIYRGVLKPVASLREFALYVAFFPQLVAGPIVRAREFLPQLDQEPHLGVERAGEALFLILKGLVKKVALADYLAVNLVDRAFDNPAWYSSAELMLALYAYCMQIYLDFSAYTDIARGSAKLFGFELPENFARPFQAQSVAEFWRRWHMTLTRWIMDYLYFPLGGSRRGLGRTLFNVAFTWIVMGLWHGAGWTYVAWGGMFGLLFMFDHLERAWFGRKGAERRGGLVGALRTFGTIQIVSLSWILFRSEDFHQVLEMSSRLIDLDLGLQQITWTVWLALVVAWGVHFTPVKWLEALEARFSAMAAPAQGLVAAAVGGLLLYLSDQMPVPFIYFQF